MRISSLASRLGAQLRRRRMSDDIVFELDTHIALLAERYEREGMRPDDARAAARRQFGNVTRIGEDIRDLIGIAWLEDLIADIRHGLRHMRHAPAFAATVIVTLALGIGANSAIFAVTNAVLLKPLPAPDPDRVVVLATTFPEGPSYVTSDQKFNLWRQQTSVLQAFAGNRYGFVNMSGIDSPEQAQAAWITDEYFQLFGIPMARGRSLIDSDTRPGAPSVAILSDGFWTRAFGARPDIIGTRISLSDARYEVIGVTAPGVETTAPNPVDVWLPLAIDPVSTSQIHYFTVEARLKPGVTISAANAQLAAAADEFRRRFPTAVAMGPRASFGVQVSRDARVANVRPALLVLSGAVALVLLIACVNVANLQFIRAIGRERELAVRAALGASRARIARQLVAEGLPMAIAGRHAGIGARHNRHPSIVITQSRHNPAHRRIGGGRGRRLARAHLHDRPIPRDRADVQSRAGDSRRATRSQWHLEEQRTCRSCASPQHDSILVNRARVGSDRRAPCGRCPPHPHLYRAPHRRTRH
jgi:putative ABC transport system permease protein